ncbi:MAG: hypothetical protein OXP69_06445 [Spirochaetaceae bacterium]|nr:hypothetical protein [Spirochaetaceae bacterium]
MTRLTVIALVLLSAAVANSQPLDRGCAPVGIGLCAFCLNTYSDDGISFEAECKNDGGMSVSLTCHDKGGFVAKVAPSKFIPLSAKQTEIHVGGYRYDFLVASNRSFAASMDELTINRVFNVLNTNERSSWGFPNDRGRITEADLYHPDSATVMSILLLACDGLTRG